MTSPLVFICEGTGMSFAEASPLRDIARQSGLQFKPVTYNSTFFPFPYDVMVRDGVGMVQNAVRSQLQYEPDRPIRIIGYSLGARIAGDALVYLARDYPGKVAGVLISDPRQPGIGMEVRRNGWRLPGITMKGERARIDAPVLRVTHRGDPISSTAGLLGYWLHHGNYHRMRHQGQPLFSWIAQRLADPPDQTVII